MKYIMLCVVRQAYNASAARARVLRETMRPSSQRSGMSSSIVEAVPLAQEVEVTADELTVTLADGRRLTVPLAWFPRLLSASPEARAEWQLLGDGEGVHWPEADEDISVAGLLAGASAAAPSWAPSRQAATSENRAARSRRALSQSHSGFQNRPVGDTTG